MAFFFEIHEFFRKIILKYVDFVKNMCLLKYLLKLEFFNKYIYLNSSIKKKIFIEICRFFKIYSLKNVD